MFTLLLALACATPSPEEGAASPGEGAAGGPPAAATPGSDAGFEEHLAAPVEAGRRLLEGGDADAALAALDRAVAARPEDPWAWYWRARALDSAGRQVEARTDALRAAGLDVQSARLRQYAADLCVQTGEWEAALEQLDRLLVLRGDDGMVHANRAFVLTKLGRRDEALAETRRACELGHQRSCGALKSRRFFEKLRAARAAERAAAGGADPRDAPPSPASPGADDGSDPQP